MSSWFEFIGVILKMDNSMVQACLHIASLLILISSCCTISKFSVACFKASWLNARIQSPFIFLAMSAAPVSFI